MAYSRCLIMRNKPRIRFKGFTEDWEQRKLGEIADITKLAGFEFTKYIVYSDKGNIIALRGLNIKDGDLNLDDIKYIDSSDFTKLKRSKLFRNDILFTYVGTIGEVARIQEDDKYYLAPNVSRIRIKNRLLSEFLMYYMDRDLFYQKIIFPLIATSSQPALSMANIREFNITYPSDTNEQQKIAQVFNRISYLITLHQRKLEKLKLAKKALLQKLFPKNGSQFPEIRFKGFTDAWEQCKLGSLASVEMNKRIFKEQTTINGDIPFYKIGTFGSDADSFISRELFEEYKNKYPYPNIGDILISASGSIGRTVVYNGEYAYFQDSNIVWLNHNGKIDNSFLLQFYNQVKWAGLEGSTIKRLYNKNILETNIALPKIEEQRLIGKFFTLVDSTITLHQRKLDKLQEVKKGLLQKMFV